ITLTAIFLLPQDRRKKLRCGLSFTTTSHTTTRSHTVIPLTQRSRNLHLSSKKFQQRSSSHAGFPIFTSTIRLDSNPNSFACKPAQNIICCGSCRPLLLH